jgi:hypothetical protein
VPEEMQQGLRVCVHLPTWVYFLFQREARPGYSHPPTGIRNELNSALISIAAPIDDHIDGDSPPSLGIIRRADNDTGTWPALGYGHRYV